MLSCIKGSKTKILKWISCLFLVLCLSVFVLSAALYESLIKEITILIDEQPGGEELRELISLHPGDPFSLTEISNSIKQIYKTGLFSDVQVIKEGEVEVNLVFLLTKNLMIRKIQLNIEEDISQKKLKAGLESIKEGATFSEDKLERAVLELRELLNREGYFNPEIRVSTERVDDSDQLDVFFQVEFVRRYYIEKIDLTGEIVLPEEQLRKRITYKEGMEFIPAVFQEDLDRLKDLYVEQDYRRAEIVLKEPSFDEIKGLVSLVIEVLPGEKIELLIKGAQVPVELLRPIWEADIFEEWGLAEGEAKIIAYLRNKGYLFATVNSRIEWQDVRMRVIHIVSPGKKYGIKNIEFQGLTYFTDSRIREELMLSKNIPLFSKISGERLFALPSEIEFLYEIYGFPETRVTVNYEQLGNTVKPIFYIEEGRQEKIEGISITGSKLFTTAQLLAHISSFEGGPFYQPNIQRDVERLEIYYLDQGVRDTEIFVRSEEQSNGLFRVNFNVTEGERVSIDKIIIAGNAVTRNNTIKREIMVQEGDFAYYNAILRTKRRLENLGIFTEVRIDEIPVSRGHKNILITVREGERNYASLGLGMETKSEPRSFAIWNNVIRPRGTAEYIRSNLFGTAAQFILVGQLSLKEKRGVVSWEQPYFFGIPMQTFLNAWIEQEERISYSFERRGISLSAVKPLAERENMIFLTALRVVRTTLFDLQIAESGVDRQHFPFSATSISGSFIWDKRDDPFNPNRGYFFSSVLEWAYPIFNDESNFQKSFSKYQHIIPLYSGINLISTTRLGLGRGRMPIHERFFGGGSNSFRGVEFDKLGPKDPDSMNPVGGKGLLLFNFELTFPILSALENLNGALFYDKGSVFSRRKQVSWDGLQDALGFGLRYRTPLGPIRFELAWNLDAVEGERKLLAFITIGNVF